MGQIRNIILISPTSPYGGASANLLRYFTFCLKDSGFNVEVFVPNGVYYGKKLDQQPTRNEQVGGINYKRLGYIYHPRNYIGKFLDNLLGLFLPFLFLFQRKLTKKLDLIIIYNPTFLTLIFHLFTKIVLNKKLIIIVPEFYEKPVKQTFSISTLKWYNFFYGIKYLYKYADEFITLTVYLKNYLTSRTNKQKKILIMPNLTDPQRFRIDNVEVFKAGCVTIGYVGTPTRKDGVLDLIRSFSILNKRNPNTHLLIIGDITNGRTIIPELTKFAKESGITEDSVTFKGLTSHLEIPSLLLSCQILALTRPKGVFAEAGFPTKLGEYFACKKPVVVTKVGDMTTYFKDKVQVIFAEPENIASIVTAFEFLINEPDKAREIGQNGYKWMDDNLNYLNQSNKISEFINK